MKTHILLAVVPLPCSGFRCILSDGTKVEVPFTMLPVPPPATRPRGRPVLEVSRPPKMTIEDRLKAQAVGKDFTSPRILRTAPLFTQGEIPELRSKYRKLVKAAVADRTKDHARVSFIKALAAARKCSYYASYKMLHGDSYKADEAAVPRFTPGRRAKEAK